MKLLWSLSSLRVNERACAMTITIKPARDIGDDEIRQLSDQNPGYQFERDRDGRLVVTPNGGESGRRSGEVFGQLRDWARRADRGPVFDASTGFKLPDGSLRSPDAAWVRGDRWEALSETEREEYPPLCPDAVFEVRSRNNSLEELRAKLMAYVENGARIAVMLDPYDRIVEVARPDRIVRETYDRLDLNDVLPGFTLDLHALK